MNWKKFTHEYGVVKAWLEEAKYSNAHHILIKFIILILRGEREPATMLSQAVRASSSFADVLRENFNRSNFEVLLELPEEVHKVLENWIYFLPQNDRVLGEIHEKLALRRRTQGLYYTPAEIIDFVMAHTVLTCDVLAKPRVKILDPACGCGYFLLQAYDVLRDKFRSQREALTERYPLEDWSDEGIHRHILRYNLWGADIDCMAVDVTAASLLLKNPEVSVEWSPNILVCDSLRNDSSHDLPEDRAFWLSSYDYVVGNPPYLSFGLRGTGRLELQYEQYLRKTFSSAEYKLSYYVLFMQKGVEMLVEGGKLGFIVPDSFLLGRYYSKIRKFIMENTAIEVIAHISAAVFKNASSGFSAICILNKQKDAFCRMNQQVALYCADDSRALGRGAPLCRYEQSYFATLPHNRFRMFFDHTAKELIDKIDASSKILRQFASGHTGIRSVSRQNDIISDMCKGDTWQKGLISGSQICRYGLEYQGHWLNIDAAALYKGGWKQEIIQQRKILVRQTGYTITACIDESGLYHLNNIHSFIIENNQVNLDYLLFILNSRLISFYYHVVTMEYGRSMAQTDIETLELLPIRVHAAINEQAPELVKAMQDCVQCSMTGDEKAKNKTNVLDEYFNQLVYRIYELTEDEIAYVERYETALVRRR